MAIGPSGDIAIIGGGSSTSGLVPDTRKINTTTPLQGGGDLSSDRTLSILQSSGAQDGYLSATDWTTFNAKVSTARLISTTAPLTGGGNLSADRTLGITQATAGTDGYLTAVDWIVFSAKMSNPMNNLGDIIYGGTLGSPTRLGIGVAGTVLHGGATPSYSQVVESDILLSAVTTNNATNVKHGFLPTLSNNSAQFLDGQGNWGTPSGAAVVSYSTTTGTGTSVTVTHNFGQYPVVQCFDSVTGAILVPVSVVHSSVNAFTVTFAVSTDYTVVATIGSPGAQAYKTVSADYPIVYANRIIKVTAAGKNITLPAPDVAHTGVEFIIDNASPGDITLLPNGAETIEGETTQPIPDNCAIHVYCDGANWRIY